MQHDLAGASVAITEQRLADYRPPAFLIDHVDLIFDLDPETTSVRATLSLRRNPAHGDDRAPLVLDGEDLSLKAVMLDGEPLGGNQYSCTDPHLTVFDPPDAFTLDTEVIIAPARNTELAGLYLSGGDFFTQCEAEGFRRITFFPDRPDVMARFSATLIGDPARCKVMLSNGNPVDRGTTADGRTWVKWVDPHPKPSYLFALVAGDLIGVHDQFTTASGRAVALGIYVRPGDEDKVSHAMECVKRSMRWDETRFGLEYDLDIFNIAAVSDFNMGAMENKGLNVFNTSLVLARPETATDADYERIDRVIGHEYFHNWTGDRVTCRDWFQLSLKEGLTVFRDQEYGTDMNDASLSRIADIEDLRARQFREDGGPLAHPVRPATYRKIDNFYTATIYNKGAEVVRMIQTLIGWPAFRRGFDLYIAKNDNKAATIEDFVSAMQEASGYDFTKFMRWYDQAGTPEVNFSQHYDSTTKRYELTLRQSTKPTPGQAHKDAFVIPVAFGLIGPDGGEMNLEHAGDHASPDRAALLVLMAPEQKFVFENIEAEPVPSLFRNFSAPIKLSGYTRAQLRHLAAHDQDGFNRWDAGHRYATEVLRDAIAAGAEGHIDDAGLLAAMAASLDHAATSPGLAAKLLELPSAFTLVDRMEVVDPVAIHTARESARRMIGQHLQASLLTTYRLMADQGDFSTDPASVGRRALRNACLSLLIAADPAEGIALAVAQLAEAKTMTASLAALMLLANQEGPARNQALAAFYSQWRHDPLVLNKWFSIQARSTAPDTLARVIDLTKHADFDIKNPNRFRSLVGAFSAGNMLHFHDASGAGYQFFARMTLALDPINRSIAARGIEAFADWRRYDQSRQAQMRAALDMILSEPTLSANTREMAERARAG
ncbi:MAG TPA: aminopeptidase N [Acidiphilium sp.]|nr:MAG: aminopeptidase N [Acidiphilium sp. 21-60-14]OYV91958.1 MAG: aminopeptidase N [Acidiphilium sp. 37-60-79]OZB39174.1 MAG: aminopeptidase N [Acidiphilium sp. 34-60-192]HQT88383.1 aminopeptidase N [Acidiphilium sp.]HQU23911.1 aminopeptidase N [Acidiphilium sp.]